VKVTRRHHPLEGQPFEVVTLGPTQIVVRLGDRTTMRLPRRWTDADGAPPPRSREGVFTSDSLRELLERVEAMRRRG
jgi:hypothetical protein